MAVRGWTCGCDAPPFCPWHGNPVMPSARFPWPRKALGELRPQLEELAEWPSDQIDGDSPRDADLSRWSEVCLVAADDLKRLDQADQAAELGSR